MARFHRSLSLLSFINKGGLFMKTDRKRWSKAFSVLASLVLALTCATTAAYGQRYRTTTLMRNVIARLETNTDRFSKSIDTALDRSRFNGTRLEDQLNALVDEMEYSTDRLKDRTEDNIANSIDVHEVLRRGMYIDMFMNRNRLTPTAQRDWRLVRSDLDKLARAYRVTWTWVPNTARDSKLNQSWTRQVIVRLEDTTDQFRSSFDAGLDQSRLDGSDYEDFMNKVVKQFEGSVDRLKADADNGRDLNQTDVRQALNNAFAIDDFLRRQTLTLRTRRDWARVKANLDDLAFLNRVAWDWTTTRPGNSPVASNIVVARGERIGLSSALSNRSMSAVAREVRHELLSEMPYYTVFDWIEFEVRPDNVVLLNGSVTAPPDKKMRAEKLVAAVEGVSRVENQIKVLPVSPNDERLRRELYNAIYNFNSPLFRYGIGSRQAIHIIVDGGRATLKGIVQNEADRNQAYIRASGVSGVFSVTNDLMVKGESLVR